MPHSYTSPIAWPIVLGQKYERFPLADTLRSPDTTGGDLRTALRPPGRWGFNLGWDVASPDDVADIMAAFEYCAGNWRSCSFLEWDTFTHDVLLSASWNGSSFVAVPFAFYEVTSIAGYIGSVPYGAILGPDTSRPFGGITSVLNYWPELGTVSVTSATLSAAGAVATNPLWLRVVGRVSYPKVRMQTAAITLTAAQNDLMMPFTGDGMWQVALTLVEDEIAA